MCHNRCHAIGDDLPPTQQNGSQQHVQTFHLYCTNPSWVHVAARINTKLKKVSKEEYGAIAVLKLTNSKLRLWDRWTVADNGAHECGRDPFRTPGLEKLHTWNRVGLTRMGCMSSSSSCAHAYTQARVWALCEMQIDSFRNSTRVAGAIYFYNDNRYATSNIF